MELGHFHNHSPTKRERKVRQGKHLFFRLETLKNLIVKEILRIDDHNWAFFLQSRALFSNLRKMAIETSPLSPSSNAPVTESEICQD